MPRTSVGVFALALALCSPALGKEWIYCRSTHFEGYREVEETADASCGLDKWEAYWQLFSVIYGPMAEKDRLVRVVTFHHASGPEDFDSPVGRGESLFIRTEFRDYLVIRESRPRLRPFVYYDASYEFDSEPPREEPRYKPDAYVRLRLSEYSLPIWFSGGLEALYTEVGRRRDGELYFSYIDPHEAEYPAIDKLLAATGSTPKTMGVTAFGERRHRYRAKAKALTNMLHRHAEYHDGYREFFSLLAAGASSEAAFQRIYGKTPEQVERDLQEYLEKRDGRVSKSVPWPEIPPETVREAPRTEEAAMLEDLRRALATGQVERVK